MKRLLLINLLCIYGFLALAQGEIDKETKIIFRNERSIGLSLNSNGFGIDYRYGKFIDGYRKWLLQSDISLLKHPKEIQSSSLLYNKKFVYGKLNTVINFRFLFGYQKELFSKNDKGGVAIRYVGLIGPTIAFVKPIMYKITYYFEENRVEDFETFYDNSNQHYIAGEIIGKASFFEGIENSKLKPGIHISNALSFEYSIKDIYINAIELGIAFDFIIDEVPIMYSENKNYQQLFTTFFISYRFGKVIDQRAIYKYRN
ncbi:MAG: hypothetical protein U9R19_17415 [Bacteroidota bacterium]|nr:hypothetical protein [Bacteroidota bacterium]